MDSLAAAYALLASQQRGGQGGGSKGVVGQDFMQLLGMLCSDYSPQASDILLRRFLRRDNDVVPFPDFESAVLCCLMYEDFIQRAEQLFTALDAAGQTGRCRIGWGVSTSTSPGTRGPLYPHFLH